MPRVSFHVLAERELNDAALYYEHERLGLGAAFLDEVEAYLAGHTILIRPPGNRFKRRAIKHKNELRHSNHGTRAGSV
jgi:hypothetical protein